MSLSPALEFTTAVLVAIGIVSVLVLVLIIVAPWRQVRDEPPLDPDVEARLLLHRPNPEEETGEMPTLAVTDLPDASEDPADPELAEQESVDFAVLSELDDPQ